MQQNTYVAARSWNISDPREDFQSPHSKALIEIKMERNQKTAASKPLSARNHFSLYECLPQLLTTQTTHQPLTHAVEMTHSGHADKHTEAFLIF